MWLDEGRSETQTAILPMRNGVKIVLPRTGLRPVKEASAELNRPKGENQRGPRLYAERKK